jgi:hypothetical protein
MDKVFRAFIRIIDQASGPMIAVNARINAAIAPLRDVGHHLNELGEAAGLMRLGEAARGVGEKFREIGHHIRELVGPLEMLGAAASIGGIVEMVKHAAEYGATLYDTALKTGVAADQLARWHFAASLTGTSVEALDKGLEFLNRTIGDSLSGKNQAMAIMFSRLHISLRDGTGHIRDASQVMGDLAEAIKRNANSPVILAEISKALGARGGAELLPLLRQGKDGLAAIAEEAEHFGLVMSTDGVKAAKEFDDSWKKVGFSIQGLSNAIGEKLFPVLKPLLDGMAEWIAANRAWIATGIANAVGAVGDALKSIDWASIKTFVLSLGEAFKFVASWLGPTGTAIAVATVLMAPLLTAVGGATWSLISLGGALAGVAMRLGLLAFSQIAGAIGTFIAAIRMGTGVMLAFNAVMIANPIALVIAGVVALGAAAFLIWKYWTPITAFFKKLWADILEIFDAAWAKIKPIVDALMAGAKGIGDVLSHVVPQIDFNAAAGGDRDKELEQMAAGFGGTYVRPQGGGAGGGRHELKITVAPEPGARVAGVSTRTSGNAAPPELDLGYGFAAP